MADKYCKLLFDQEDCSQYAKLSVLIENDLKLAKRLFMVHLAQKKINLKKSFTRKRNCSIISVYIEEMKMERFEKGKVVRIARDYLEDGEDPDRQYVVTEGPDAMDGVEICLVDLEGRYSFGIEERVPSYMLEPVDEVSEKVRKWVDAYLR